MQVLKKRKISQGWVFEKISKSEERFCFKWINQDFIHVRTEDLSTLNVKVTVLVGGTFDRCNVMRKQYHSNAFNLFQSLRKRWLDVAVEYTLKVCSHVMLKI